MSSTSCRERVWRVGAVAGVLCAITASCNALSGVGALEIDDCVGAACLDATTNVDGNGTDAFHEGERSEGAADASADAADAKGQLDAANDVVASDCGAQFYCESTGSCVAACKGCPSGLLECASLARCLGSCTVCGVARFDCIQCSGGGPGGKCAANATTCVSGAFVGCPCTPPDAGICPGATQVCGQQDLECQPCGAPNSNGRPCKNGSACNQATGTCP